MHSYLALVHHPVLNKRGEEVTTSVTNLDIHDLARTARTYDVAGTFIITPIQEQKHMVQDIIDHWLLGEAGQRNPDRKEAFTRVHVVASIQEASQHILKEQPAQPVKIIGSSAKKHFTSSPFSSIRQLLNEEEGNALILLGTGWGLPDSVISNCDLMLPPIHAIEGRRGYNHLPVRSACAIILDRLFGAP